MQGNAIHAVADQPKTAKLLIAIYGLRAARIASMNNPVAHQMRRRQF
jgi:hypothetical protein